MQEMKTWTMFQQLILAFAVAGYFTTVAAFSQNAIFATRLAKDNTHNENNMVSSNCNPNQQRRQCSLSVSMSPTSKEDDPLLSLNLNLRNLAPSSTPKNKKEALASAERAEQLLLRIENLYLDGYYDSRPDVVSYNSGLRAWAKSGGGRRAALRAEGLLNRMERLMDQQEDQSEDDDAEQGLRPNTWSYNTVIHAWARSAHEHKNQNQTNRKPTPTSQSPSSASKAHEILQRMEDAYHSGRNPSCKPDTISYNSVIDAHAKVGDAMGAELVLARLVKVPFHFQYQNEDNNNNDDLLPPPAVVMQECIDTDMLQLQRQLDDQPQSQHKNNPHTAVLARPNTRTFNGVMAAWAKSGHILAPYRALQLLRFMQQDSRGGTRLWDCTPCVFSYSTVMSTMARASGQHPHGTGAGTGGSTTAAAPNADRPTMMAEAAETLLQELHQTYHQTPPPANLPLQPNGFAYGAAIHAWSNLASSSSFSFSSSSSFGLSPRAKWEAAQRAQDILHQMETQERVDTDVAPYSTALQAWAKCGGGEKAALKAEGILKHMEDLADHGNNHGGGGRVRPNVRSYAMVMDAWAKSGTTSTILFNTNHASDDMEETDKCTEINYDEPTNAVSSNNTITKTGDSAERAHAILRHMMQRCHHHQTTSTSTSTTSTNRKRPAPPTPNTVCYNAVLDAYAKSHRLDKARRAWDVFLEMRALASSTTATASSSRRPSSRFANRSTAGTATAAGSTNTVAPDLISHNCVLNACATLGREATVVQKEEAMQIATKAFRALHEVKEQYSPRGPKSRLQQNQQQQQQQQQRMMMSPSSATYAYFLKACATLLTPPPSYHHQQQDHGGVDNNDSKFDATTTATTATTATTSTTTTTTPPTTMDSITEERCKLACKAFDLCKQNGKVSHEVLHRLRQCVPQDTYNELVLLPPHSENHNHKEDHHDLDEIGDNNGKRNGVMVGSHSIEEDMQRIPVEWKQWKNVNPRSPYRQSQRS